MIDLVIASHNQGKALDLARLFEGCSTGLGFASDLGLPDVEETGQSFEENAILKAVHASSRLACPALGDDSGLCIPSWNNKPGIHTKRSAMSQGAGPMRCMPQSRLRSASKGGSVLIVRSHWHGPQWRSSACLGM